MKKLFFLDRIPAGWARFCAQVIDYALVYLLFTAASFFLPFYIEDLYYLGVVFFIPVFWMPVEALLISRYKTTLGKKLFGIRIEDHLGKKLPYGIALKRACFLGKRPGIIRQTSLGLLRYTVAICTLLFLTGVSVFEKEITVLTTGFEKCQTIDGWVDYTSTDGGFRVLFPQIPEEESKLLPVSAQGDNLSYQEVTSYQTKKVYYSISYMDLPRKWKLAGANRLLNGALDLIVEHTPGAKLLCKSMTKHQNFRSLDFHIAQEGAEEAQGRLILVDMTLYRLTVVYPQDLVHQSQHTEFLNSFEVQG